MNNSTVQNALLRLQLSADYARKPCVLRNIRLEIGEGEIVGLMGESGSGKSTLALAILRLLEHKGGTIRGQLLFCDRDLGQLTAREMRHIRGKEIAFVSQNASASLNPAMQIESQFVEASKAHQTACSNGWKRNVLDIFEQVGLPADEKFLRVYPHQLSVGQAQRVLIAMAILHRPKLLIADEPTSALDVITESEVIDVLKQLNSEMRMAVLFISHDLLLISSFCRRVAILKNGEIVENGSAAQIFASPEHPYTRALLRTLRLKLSRPTPDFRTSGISGEMFMAPFGLPNHVTRVRGAHAPYSHS